jgi:hypothetical protein
LAEWGDPVKGTASFRLNRQLTGFAKFVRKRSTPPWKERICLYAFDGQEGLLRGMPRRLSARVMEVLDHPFRKRLAGAHRFRDPRYEKGDFPGTFSKIKKARERHFCSRAFWGRKNTKISLRIASLWGHFLGFIRCIK